MDLMKGFFVLMKKYARLTALALVAISADADALEKSSSMQTTTISKTDDKGVTLRQRTIPWPRSISAEAVAGLKSSAQVPPISTPDIADIAAWRKLIADQNANDARYIQPVSPEIEVTEEQVAGVKIYRARPRTLPADDQRLYIEIHGGGLIFGAGAFTRSMGAMDAHNFQTEVIALDYRVPPDHPFPAALEDCLAVYAAEVKRRGAHNIIVGGGSAGGNLAAALMLRARQAGLPMPAALVLQTPEVDLTESGDSFETLMGLDPVLPSRLTAFNALYANGHSLEDPLVSPLFGDLTGFPPTLLQSGTRDLFLSNTVRMHRRLREASVAAELHVFEAMPHGGFMGAPEDEGVKKELTRFVAAHWPRKAGN